MKPKVFDCILFFDENDLLEIRLNILDKYVDYFVIVEALQDHRGNKKEINLDLRRFKQFSKKIRHIKINLPDTKKNSDPWILENFQRNQIILGIENADPEDLIIVSDVDEIPNLEKININNISDKIYIFKQKHFYFKLNLLSKYIWTKSKMCKKKILKTPQWLRNIKPKKYSFFRLDSIFSNKKYSNIQFIENGGWHFSYVKSLEDIKKKISSFAHKELDNLDFNNLENINMAINKKINIFDNNSKLEVIQIDETYPSYIQQNLNKFKNFLA